MSNVGHPSLTNHQQQSSGNSGGASSLNFGVVAAIAAAASLFLLAAVLYIRHVMSRFEEIVARNTRPPKPRLEPAAVDALPAFTYHGRASSDGSGSTTQCTICLSPMKEGEMVKLLPDCGHVFHLQCIDTWLPASATCPVCRAVVIPLAGEVVTTIEASPPTRATAVAAAAEVSPQALPPV